MSLKLINDKKLFYRPFGRLYRYFIIVLVTYMKCITFVSIKQFCWVMFNYFLKLSVAFHRLAKILFLPNNSREKLFENTYILYMHIDLKRWGSFRRFIVCGRLVLVPSWNTAIVKDRQLWNVCAKNCRRVDANNGE